MANVSDVFELTLFTEKMKSVASNFRSEVKRSKDYGILFFERSWAFAYGTLFSLTGLYYKSLATLKISKYKKLPSLKQDALAYVLLNNAIVVADTWTKKFDLANLSSVISMSPKYGNNEDLQKQMEKEFPWVTISLNKPRSKYRFVSIEINETALKRGVSAVLKLNALKENPKVDSLKKRLFSYKSKIRAIGIDSLIERYVKLRFIGGVSDALVDLILGRSNSAKKLFGTKASFMEEL